MKFLDILFGKYKKPQRGEEPEFTSECKKIEIDNNIPDIIGELSMEIGSCLIRELEIDFMQDVDKDNHPHGTPYGGFISLVLHDKPDYKMVEWIISSQKRYDGEIRFYKNTTQNAENALMNILFCKACCVNYKMNYDALQNKELITLCICPRTIKIGHEEFE